MSRSSILDFFIVGRKYRNILILLFCLFLNAGCAGNFLKSTDVRIIEYHTRECITSIEEFSKRLYAKNPNYESDKSKREAKLQSIFSSIKPTGKFSGLASNELLTSAFAVDALDEDRVYLLTLGLVKSINEAYGINKRSVLISAMQVDLERLERLHHNISQVNWRLKTYKDNSDKLIFLTNAVGKNGYINMGYEVIMTEILTRIKDDIFLRGGLPSRYFLNMSTLFFSLLI